MPRTLDGQISLINKALTQRSASVHASVVKSEDLAVYVEDGYGAAVLARPSHGITIEKDAA